MFVQGQMSLRYLHNGGGARFGEDAVGNILSWTLPNFQVSFVEIGNLPVVERWGRERISHPCANSRTFKVPSAPPYFRGDCLLSGATTASTLECLYVVGVTALPRPHLRKRDSTAP